MSVSFCTSILRARVKRFATMLQRISPEPSPCFDRLCSLLRLYSLPRTRHAPSRRRSLPLPNDLRSSPLYTGCAHILVSPALRRRTCASYRRHRPYHSCACNFFPLLMTSEGFGTRRGPDPKHVHRLE